VKGLGPAAGRRMTLVSIVGQDPLSGSDGRSKEESDETV
jgi:hypothetical protein